MLTNTNQDLGKGATVLSGAAQEGHTEYLQLLLADARVEPVNKAAFNGATPPRIATWPCVHLVLTDPRTDVDTCPSLPQAIKLMQAAAAENHPGAIACLTSRNLPLPPCTTLGAHRRISHPRVL